METDGVLAPATRNGVEASFTHVRARQEYVSFLHDHLSLKPTVPEVPGTAAILPRVVACQISHAQRHFADFWQILDRRGSEER